MAFAWRSRHRRLLLSTALLALVGILGWRGLPVGAAITPQPVTATFDSRIDLVGYAIASSEIAPGGVLDITLYWFTRQAPPENYKVFIHLDGPNGGQGRWTRSRVSIFLPRRAGRRERLSQTITASRSPPTPCPVSTTSIRACITSSLCRI